jgi:glutathione S-transferase
MRAVFDEMNKRLADGRPYLMGDRFGAIDIAFAAFSSPLFAPPEHPLRRETRQELPTAFLTESTALRDTPAGKHALRMYREHRV